MRDKRLVLAAAFIIIMIIVVMLAAMLTASPGDRGENGEDPVFGDTSGQRVGVILDERRSTDGDPVNLVFRGNEGTEDAPQLRAVSVGPVAGGVAYRAGDTQTIRYIDHTTGNTFDTPLTTIEEPRLIANDTLLRIGRVFWTPSASSVLIQRLGNDANNIYSYLGTYGTTTGSARKMQGRHLPDNLLTAAVSPLGTEVFYLVEDEAGGSVGYIETIAVGTRTEVIRLPLRGITANWDAPNTIVLYTKPASIAPGFVWLLNPTTGDSEVVLRGEYALAARMNPSGDKLLYSLQETSGGLVSLRVLDMTTGEVAYIPNSSIIEKCAWGTVNTHTLYCAMPANILANAYLEGWYMGTLRSIDTLWQVHVDTMEMNMVLDPVELTTDTFDISDISVSPNEDYVLFRTRDNGILWAAKIPVNLTPLQKKR